MVQSLTSVYYVVTCCNCCVNTGSTCIFVREMPVPATQGIISKIYSCALRSLSTVYTYINQYWLSVNGRHFFNGTNLLKKF